MAKTIMKLYPNGNLETVNTPLTQSGITNNYKFSENGITVPKIIEYPPVGYRNYFIDRTSISGWLSPDNGTYHSADEWDRTSDFIPLPTSNRRITIRVRYKNLKRTDPRAWVCGFYYNVGKQFIDCPLDLYTVEAGATGERDFEFVMTPPTNISFARFCLNLYDNSSLDIKVSVEIKGTGGAINKHYLAFEDMPGNGIDTGQPFSFFSDGIVIKGLLI